ncbi:MAG: dihydrodipicolinate synthase family protein [Bacteroidales bacterium]|nr:dihydrodipicolinate synthase family protein [Bacteroidales bacterium]
MIRFKNGFYAALGTPADENGTLIRESFAHQIELMISAGASGLLCMGSMGRMESIRDRDYRAIAEACASVVGNRIPVLVGVMDCSTGRVLDRIESLKGLQIDGVVATPPFYSKVGEPGMIRFFEGIAKNKEYPVFIYDLPSVTQSPVTIPVIRALSQNRNIKGIKTANMNLILDLERNGISCDDFSVFYSNLDSFDAAIRAGIMKNLDGMYSCSPVNTRLMYSAFNDIGSAVISQHLNNILKLRNLFLREDVLASYSFAMELIGCPGNYHCDYSPPVSAGLKEMIFNCMKEIGEI